MIKAILILNLLFMVVFGFVLFFPITNSETIFLIGWISGLFGMAIFQWSLK